MELIGAIVVGLLVAGAAIWLDRTADRLRERAPSEFQRRGLIRWLWDRRGRR
jgi:hypothetical protein